MANIEDIALIKRLRSRLPDELGLTDKIMQALKVDRKEFDRRASGLYREDEFLLILAFADVCDAITGTDEKISRIYGTHTSDLKVRFKRGAGKGNWFYIEIKHTDAKKYSISAGNLEKRINYAKDNGAELLFAISIHGYWMMFPADYLKSKGGKITLKDFKSSVLDDYLDNCSYLFIKGTEIKSVYEPSDVETPDTIYHEKYGRLISYELLFQGRRIFKIHSMNNPNKKYSFVLEALQDRLSNDKQLITHKGSKTMIREIQTEDIQVLSEWQIELAVIPHMFGNVPRQEAYARYADELERGENKGLSPNYIRNVLLDLHSRGLMVLCMRNWLICDIDEVFYEDTKGFEGGTRPDAEGSNHTDEDPV